MKKNKIFIAMAALAILATACGKDNEGGNDGRIKIFAENMSSGNNGAKVLMDPTNLDGSQWVLGERVNLNGTAYSIVEEGGSFYLNTDGATLRGDNLYAIYPASVEKVNGDHIIVSNNNTDAGSVVIHSLTVNFAADGQKVYFPMAATAEKNASTMTFKHLTGGLKLSLKNKKTSALNVAKLVVTVTNVSNEGAIYKDLKPAWVGGMLPALPEDEIGNISGDPGAEFVSSMTLYLRDEETSLGYKQMAAKDNSGDELVFCMPLLAKSVKYLQITGYDDSGSTIFTTPQKVIENPFDVARNIMYTIPTINIINIE